ncbi:hypothetical protein DL762_002874 [Monosporascus cannonballus]|uniref:C2H2-type domain-containing protein n=1 Tax=Monosporascus cannonballus TaxID=155416 RepID=A0ABY0HCC9_9PEZI|nr:hypothetical protein DL762_002874 [Monosporascus cannonballus]
MTSSLDPKAALVARSSSISPGGIAGAVIGSLFGGGLLLIVLGFLYFRYRRKSREFQAEEGIPTAKPSESHRRSSLCGQAFPPAEPPPQQSPAQPSMKYERTGQYVPAPGGPAGSQAYPTYVPRDDLIRCHGTISAQSPYPLYYTRYIEPSSRAPGLPGTEQPTSAQSLDHDSAAPVAANSSYYDTRISMDSDPALPPVPPTEQMNELYQAQLKQSREKQGSTGSSIRRLIDYAFRRKRSTHGSVATYQTARTTTPQQFFPTSPVDVSIAIKQEPDTDASRGIGLRSFPPGGEFTAEPESYADSPTTTSPSGVDKSRKERDQIKQKYMGRAAHPNTQNISIRTDSGLRQITETESELPSVAFGADVVSSPADLYGLPPVGTALAQPPSRVQERLQSPDIPEPMDIDTTDAPGPSGLRSSHSPVPLPETFVSPMKIMNPSTATEKAAYTEYQIENSASPPPMPAAAEFITDHARPDAPDIDAPYQYDDEVDVDQYLDIPSPDEPRRSGDSFEFSTTPGLSSTDPSSERTPDTRLTGSLSPYPVAPPFLPVKTEPGFSASPEGSRPSPPSGPLMCEECGRTFDQIHKLNHHKRYHDRKHNCPYDGCDKKFGTKTHLDRHINDKHLKTKAFHCTDPRCPYFKGGKAFPRKDNWRRHMIKKHQATPAQLEGLDEVTG